MSKYAELDARIVAFVASDFYAATEDKIAYALQPWLRQNTCPGQTVFALLAKRLRALVRSGKLKINRDKLDFLSTYEVAK